MLTFPRNAPNVAKSDLKRQLKNFKVRPAIEQAIVRELAPAGSRPETPSASLSASASAPPRPVSRAGGLGTSVASSVGSERPITPAPAEPPSQSQSQSQHDPAEPMYVNTARELGDILKGMAWDFEGRESEQNWEKRERSMKTLRKLLAGNAPADFHDQFLIGLKNMQDGIIKSLTSLRTSLAKEGCAVVEDIAQTFGAAMEPMVELLMQTLMKMSAATKKITSSLANSTVDTIIGKVPYTPRLMYHISSATQDKNVQPRTFATGWLKTLLKKAATQKHHIEHTGGVDLLEKCLKKGLADANPTVREKMRSTFWTFWGIWPARADAILADLDPTAQKLLNKDPSNPNSPKKAESARPGLSKGATASKPSLREAMMAQKRANLSAAKNLPARPGSAMAQISPVRTTSNSSAQSTAPVASKPARTRPESTTISVKAGGMSVAPMRPSRRRPEVARPATAGPYSVRDEAASVEVDSPDTLRAKSRPVMPKGTTPQKPASKPTHGHVSRVSESSIPSPTARAGAKPRHSPRSSPGKPRQHQDHIVLSSPPKMRDETTLVPPRMPSEESSATAVEEPEPEVYEDIEREPEALNEPDSDPVVEVVEPVGSPEVPRITLEAEPAAQSAPLKVYEDPFTEQQRQQPVSPPVLEDKPVNEDAAKLAKTNGQAPVADEPASPNKSRQNARLLDSGISKINAMSLEVHGFRKLQSLVRDSSTVFSDDKFEALLLGLFRYLENPLSDLSADKCQDVKAQILTTIKLLLRKERDNFQPHVSKGLEALLETRARYDSRAHVVSGLELLADELVTIGDESEIVMVLTGHLQQVTDATTEGCRSLSMGLHVLKEMLDKRGGFVPAGNELERLTSVAGRCIESADSGVRMDAVKFCVALHSRVGEVNFWEALQGVKDDPKSLITYYIVKKQREGVVA